MWCCHCSLTLRFLECLFFGHTFWQVSMFYDYLEAVLKLARAISVWLWLCCNLLHFWWNSLMILSVLIMFYSKTKIIEQIVFYSCPTWKDIWLHMKRLSVPSRTVCFDSNLITQQTVMFSSSAYRSVSLLECEAQSRSTAKWLYLLRKHKTGSLQIMIVWQSSDTTDKIMKHNECFKFYLLVLNRATL